MNNWTFEEIQFGTPEYDSALRLRDKVLREPLDLEFTQEQISQEWAVNHLVAIDPAGIIRGVLILQSQDANGTQVKMRQVAVDPNIQSQGIGSNLVKFSEAYAKINGAQQFVLNARTTAVKFYKKLGYKTQGKEFEEVGIPHYKMTKDLI